MIMVYSRRGSRSSETVFVRAPANRLGGRAPGYWQYDGQRKSAAGVAGLVPRKLTPPPTSQRKIIT